LSKEIAKVFFIKRQAQAIYHHAMPAARVTGRAIVGWSSKENIQALGTLIAVTGRWTLNARATVCTGGFHGRHHGHADAPGEHRSHFDGQHAARVLSAYCLGMPVALGRVLVVRPLLMQLSGLTVHLY